MRLVGGAVSTVGRVEFCFGGQWGTVCSARDRQLRELSWNSLHVGVVCKQLGYFTLGMTL